MFRKLLAITILCAAGAGAQTLAIRAGNLVDPATGTVKRNQIILVRDGKISEVGPQVAIPAGAEVIDLSNAWVLPGLMDAHAHLTLGVPREGLLEAEYLKASSALRALYGLRKAREALEAGFTAIRDVGNDANFSTADVQRAIARGWFTGPTLITTGKIIAPFGGQSRGIPPELGPFWRFEYQEADSPDAVRRAVRENIYYGATAIKLVADNNPYTYSVAEIRAAVEEAAGAGMKVAVHVLGDKGARAAIQAGAHSLEHCFECSDDVLRLMKERGIFLVGTDFPLEHLKFLGDAGGILPPPEVTSRAIIDRLRRAHRVGVKMAFGTDVFAEIPGRTRGELMLDYLDVWRQAGVPPADILKAMTTNCAELFGWTGKRGAIAPGEAADIIATAGNPLEDILALRKVTLVMKDGRVVKK
jgi:imidazolonepropionase-like amidohydrolase